MSISQTSKVTPVTTVLRGSGGCGDYTSTPDSVSEKHVPVPSCRKFTLRSSPTPLGTPTKLQTLISESLKTVEDQERERRRQSTSDAHPRRIPDQETNHIPTTSQSLQQPGKTSRNSRKQTPTSLVNRCRRRRSSSIDEIRMKRNRDGAKSANLSYNQLIRTHRNGATLHGGESNPVETAGGNNLTSPLRRTPISDNYIADLAIRNGNDEATLYVVEQASRRIAFMLILNAWRHCRSHMNNSKQVTTKLESQVDQQHLQIRLLREIITTDNSRVAIANDEARKAQEQVVEMEAQLVKVQQEKVEAEKKITTLESQILDLNTEIKNSHNRMIVVQSQVQSLEEQLAKDREKLNRMREDKKLFVDKLKHAEEKIQQKEIDIETLQAVYAQIEERLDEQKMINISCMDEIEANNQIIKEMQDHNEQLEKEKCTIEKIVESRDIELLTVRENLQKAQEMIANLGEQNEELERRLGVSERRWAAQAERTWWSRAAELASGPLDVLHTAACIALPALPSADRFRQSNENFDENENEDNATENDQFAKINELIFEFNSDDIKMDSCSSLLPEHRDSL